MIYAEEPAGDTAQSLAKEMGAGESGVTLSKEEVTAPLGGGVMEKHPDGIQDYGNCYW